MTPEQRARLERVAAKASTADKTYWVPGDDNLFPAIAAALARIDALEEAAAHLAARLDRADCTAREGGDTRHCRHDHLCLRCERDHAKQRIATEVLAPRERRCGTCREWISTPGGVRGDCYASGPVTRMTRDTWFCADWTAKEEER